VRRNERLASPRGRIDVNQIANDCGVLTASLPCQHHPRIEDTPINQVLLAGLKLAGSMASLIDLRRNSQKLASMLEEQVSFLLLDNHVIAQTERRMNRLTSAYNPAISIIRLLLESQGIVFEGERTTSKLPGFLFDMNMFFQALLSRFFKENLEGFDVRDEHGLKGMMQYSREFNPLKRRSPTPRPDFAVLKDGKLLTILDAKYRDLWETKLPRNMLYQLVVYAVSQVSNPQSAIIYPTLNPAAKEQRIVVNDPIQGGQIGLVCLKPINLALFSELVSDESRIDDRRKLAKRLAFE
jgi:5-methylcytosine-specific restriction enzyme subunit McrC